MIIGPPKLFAPSIIMSSIATWHTQQLCSCLKEALCIFRTRPLEDLENLSNPEPWPKKTQSETWKNDVSKWLPFNLHIKDEIRADKIDHSLSSSGPLPTCPCNVRHPAWSRPSRAVPAASWCSPSGLPIEICTNDLQNLCILGEEGVEQPLRCSVKGSHVTMGRWKEQPRQAAPVSTVNHPGQQKHPSWHSNRHLTSSQFDQDLSKAQIESNWYEYDMIKQWVTNESKCRKVLS